MTRKALLVLAVSSLCGILTAPVGAQTAASMSRYDIPFQFSANGKTMPAGQYIVGVRAVDSLVEIESQAAHRQAVVCLTHPAGMAAAGESTLTFHRYGNRYFLARISQQGKYETRGLALSPAEREAAKAPTPAPLEKVTVAALSPTR